METEEPRNHLAGDTGRRTMLSGERSDIAASKTGGTAKPSQTSPAAQAEPRANPGLAWPENLEALRHAVRSFAECSLVEETGAVADIGADHETSRQRGAVGMLASLRTVEEEITAALREGQFVLFLQPQVALQNFSISGAEVLLRWQHPKRGLILPGEFLPLAESTQQVGEIGRWVLKSVCENFKHWMGWMGGRGSIAVNVSPMELLDSRFLFSTLSTLGLHQIPDAGVELELVETAVLANPALASETIICLRRNGIRMALDDFGVGYATLSSLRDYPFTKIKIDRSFLQQLHSSERNRTIVRSMIELGKSLRLTVNAEGVETPEQLRFLFEHGCDEVQGYLFARPMPPARFREWAEGFQSSVPCHGNALGEAGGCLSPYASAGGDGKVIAFSRRTNFR